MFNSPPVKDKVCMRHNQDHNVLRCNTEEGHRAQVHYTTENHPKYTLYVSGDKDYGTASFLLFIKGVTGDKPIVENVLSESELYRSGLMQA